MQTLMVTAGWWMVCAVGLAALGQQAQAEAADGAWRAEADKAVWRYEVEGALPAAVTARLRLAEAGRPLRITVGEEGAAEGVLRIDVQRDKDGRILTAKPATHEAGAWTNGTATSMTFWPAAKDAKGLARLEEDGLEPRSWQGRDLPLRVELREGRVLVWLAGKLIGQAEAKGAAPRVVSLLAAEGDAVAEVETEALAGGWRFVPVDLTPIANEALPQPIASEAVAEVAGVPFELADGGRRWLNLESAQWTDQGRDPGSFYESYDEGPEFIGDPRMPMIQVPRGDYVAAHVLAVAEGGEAFSDRLTLRAGRYNHAYRGQAVRYDFGGDVPRAGAGAGAAVTTSAGPLYAVRVPMSAAFAQDILDEVIDVELTKEVRLARRSPDPNRFRWRPLGLPSGVRIAGITLERSPLQMRVGSGESGHLFVQPQTPTFSVELSNITDRPQGYRLTLTATHFHGQTTVAEAQGQVEAGTTATAAVALPDAQRGYHDLRVALRDGEGRLLLERQTSFAVLPDKDRPHHETSRVGVWDFTGGHLTPSDPDFVGPLYQKLGLRYGMFHHKAEDRARYGVRKGNEFGMNSRRGAEGLIDLYKEQVEKHPDLLPHLLVFHEDSVSGPHVTRVPDLFHDRPAYQFDEDEQKRFEALFEMATQAAKAMRAYDPSVKIILGNGPLPLREEFYRHGFPAELFDAAGNEAGVFGRPPETQPPDPVTNNASLWMDRQMLDHYGYEDTPVVQCYEIIYPSTNPGNLSYETQAAYMVRHILHSMAWGIPQIRVGSLTDMANSYYFSNWGSSGIFRKLPEVSPKPSAIALGTLTWVLDGASFDRSLPTGSASLYALAFDRPQGGQVVALWTIRGERPVTLGLTGATKAVQVDSQGIETALPIGAGGVTLTVTPTPSWLVMDGRVTGVEAGAPTYRARPGEQTAVVDPLDSLKGWAVAEQRNPELEYYNPMTPRRKGDFRFEMVREFEGRSNVVRVTPQPIDHGKATMPMYAELVHGQGIELPGEPTDIGLWVNGNSSWGRVIYELEDAKGERWVSIGAPAKGGSAWMADWLPKEMLDKYDPDAIADWNTDDVFGVSRINFDGWRYLSFPLPGQYPGEGYHRPVNSQWRYDQEGRVDYPLTLKKLIVELPEKTLHVQEFAPVDRPAIYLSELRVEQGERGWVKSTPGEYVSAVQMGGL